MQFVWNMVFFLCHVGDALALNGATDRLVRNIGHNFGGLSLQNSKTGTQIGVKIPRSLEDVSQHKFGIFIKVNIKHIPSCKISICECCIKVFDLNTTKGNDYFYRVYRQCRYFNITLMIRYTYKY